MKVLFEFSRSGLDIYKSSFQTIRDTVLVLGHSLTHDLLKETEKRGVTFSERIFDKITKAISSADCVIIEGSAVSMSLGFILTESLNLGKPVLFVCANNLKHSNNRFVYSIKNKLLVPKVYNDKEDLEAIVKDFILNNKHFKTRFNLVLSNELNSYITIKSNSLGISKTEYIINLIKTDIKNKQAL